MMKEISDMRSSIMRCNAQIVDWLVEYVGPVQMQLVHKKPSTAAYVTPSPHSSIVSCDRAHGTSLFIIQ